MRTLPPGSSNVEPHLTLVQDWLADGHTVEETRELFESYGIFGFVG